MKHLKTFESFLFEEKEVGLIYHFTSLDALEDILAEDKMIANYGYMSFSRNPLLASTYEYAKKEARITFDGDEMSNKFRFEPFMFGGRYQYGAEREERIKQSEINGIKKYIIQAEAIKPKAHIKEFEDKIEKMKKENPGIDLEIVHSFINHYRSLMVA